MSTKRTALIGALIGVASGASAQSFLQIDFSGEGFFDSFGDFDNFASVIDVNQEFGLASGQVVRVTSVGWDLTIETNGPSILADAVFHFDDADAGFPPSASAFNVVPGDGDLFSGSMAYSSAHQALGSELVLSGGNLYLELFDAFDDLPDEADATVTGFVSLGVTLVPAPGAVALLGLGGLVATRRRR